MENHKDNIKVQSEIFHVHMLLYALVILFLVQLVWVGKGVVFYVGLGLLIYFLFMVIIESVAYVDGSETISLTPPLFYFYRSTQLISSMLMFFMNGNVYTSVIGASLLIIFSLEVLYYIDFSELAKRLIFYTVLLIPFISSAFLWTFLVVNDDLSGHFHLIIATVVLTLVIILIGEVMAKIWNYYEYRMLGQERKVGELEEVNSELMKKQEKLNKVNELLGMQKVQLQTANRRINHAHNEMVVQNEVARVMASSLDLERMTEDLCRILLTKMGLDYVAIILETEEQSLSITYRTTKGDDFALELWKQIQEGKYDFLLDINHIMVENKGREKRSIQYMNSIVSVPLWHGNRRSGNLVVAMEEEDAFLHSGEFYETIGGQISVGVNNAILYQRMEDMAIRDGLTGIYNRRYIAEVLLAKIMEAKRHKTSVSLALFDIDKFKMVNDTFGHSFGDLVICHVAKTLQRVAEENGGLAGRYGGEEFVIAFPGKGVEETYEIVRQVHQEIHDSVVEDEDKKTTVSVSVGISSYPETCEQPKDVLTRADWAMYHSKRNGRDQITIDNDQIVSKM